MASAATKFMCLFLIFGLVAPSLATNIPVGGLLGWCPLNIGGLVSWLLGTVCHVGDTLYFLPPLGQLPTLAYLLPDLVAYQACDFSAAVQISVDANGVCLLPLAHTGPIYVAASVDLCKLGLKFTTTVVVE